MAIATAGQRPALAEATTTTVNFSIDIDFEAFVPCANGGAGELIVGNGPLHVLLHTTESASGNVQMKFHFQPQGIKSVGQDTGDVYKATGVTQQTFRAAKGSSFTFVNNLRQIGPGPGNNFLVHETLHVTVNANGQVTADHVNTSLECR